MHGAREYPPPDKGKGETELIEKVKRVDRGKRLRMMDPELYREKLKSLLLGHITIDENGCWRWTGMKQRNGYGSSKLLGKNTPAHRVSYHAFKGDISEGMEVCHTCDVRDCINPSHLFLGTHLENMQDANRKGKIHKGASNNRSISVRVNGITYGSLHEAGRALGVGHWVISRMVSKNRASITTEVQGGITQ